jgi:single-stranded DNA-binding protein
LKRCYDRAAESWDDFKNNNNLYPMIKLEIAGRATRDSEVHNLKTCATVANVTVAVTVPMGKDKNGGVFIDLKCWPPFDGIAGGIRKGDPVYAVCTARTEEWEKDGKQFKKTVWIPVILSGGSGGARSAAPASTAPAAKADTDDDLPF